LLPDATVARSILAGAGVTAEVETTSLGVVCHIEQSAMAAVALAALRDSELDFRVLVDLLGTDAGEDVEVTYHMRSLARDEEIFVKTHVAYDGQLVSVWNVFASALLPERETAELFGLVLSGHPNPKRLLTTEGVEPLLRRSVEIRTAEEVRAR
jgi:NADH-quinone oxidoreductase subunit C